MSRRREVLLLALAGLVLAGLLSIRIDAPWIFVHDDNGAWTQAVATAHLRAGIARTRGQDFMLRRSDGALVPYLHHPPLYPLVMAAAYRVTGRSDPLVTRLVPAAFHMLGFVGFCLLARRLFPDSPSRRVIASFVYAVVPMSSFFGKMPFNEALGLCGCVWGTSGVAALRSRQSEAEGWAPASAPAGRGRLLVATCLAWGLAGLTSWPAYVVLFGLWALLAIEGWRRHERGPIVALAVVGLGTFALVMAQLQWAGGLTRLSLAAGHWGAGLADPARMIDSLARGLRLHRLYFANVPAALFIAWIILEVHAAARGRGGLAAGSPHRLLLAGAAGAALWAIVFVRQIGLHGYGQIWFLPFESLAAADAAVRAWSALAPRPALRRALALTAAAAVAGSCAVTLVHRYTRPLAYAIEAAGEIRTTFETRP